MNYIKIKKENIDKEHICCAMFNKQCVAKKDGMAESGLTRDLFFTEALSAASALLSTFRLKMTR